MKLGIIQGRLSKPIDNFIQEFPTENWEKEFNLLESLNLNHIEWIITKKSFAEGITNLDIKRFSDKISSICCDNLIDQKIVDYFFLEKNLIPICDWAIKNDIFSINIPLLEDSLVNQKNKNIIFKNLKRVGDKYPNINFNFELESEIELCLELVQMSKNFFLVYDTGNITSCGFNHNEWINKGYDYIRHIHLKDRTKNPIKTVEPFTGDTDFYSILDLLNKKGYNYYYTLQTCRGITGEETKTIKKHIKLFSRIL